MKLNIQRFAPDYDQLDVTYDHIKKGDGTKLQVDSAIRDDEGHKISTYYAKKNELPTVNDATLTIQKNGTNVQTFTANQSTNATANIIVPTKTSDLTNDDNVVKDASYVHTDNNYTTTEKNKLSGIASGAEVNVQANWSETNTSSDAYIKNKPTIPTVNNATLTIQKNGTTVNTFTANASSNVTANITVPTKISDLTNDSGFITSSYHDNTKQDTLVSGTNIKTVGGTSLLGSGDIPISGGTTTDVQVNGTSITSGGVANLVTQTAYNSSTNKIATKSDIPTKVSQLTNDSGFTSNTGTITGIKMNGSSKGTSGVVDLGTVITSHQTIKTINNTSMTGSGNVSVQPTLVSGTNIKTVNSTSLLGSGNVAVQPTLVSGTNIKTINSTSLLGSGNISVQSTLSVTTGTNAVTKTSGNATIRESDYYQYGKVVEMRLVLDTTASTSAGSNLFQGTIKSALKPMDYVTGVGFNGGTIQVGQISPDGEVLIRNCVSSLASGKATGIHFTYLIS